ncbi:hypothetical protein [Effusibacillus lacus]|uniref:Uncharacterized protein n=1 Tax=Effusibacillus lacus TaxID=1348429 RepID=A0A292YQG1_9BACL|nr:hypothetical protein [Effusibacillus lacus]TCS70647.1 hypothetical protein EDD64_13139 [Effusibacillus lacus]GAX90644.1 hypothetical protein [Effusibacillus lacus]
MLRTPKRSAPNSKSTLVRRRQGATQRAGRMNQQFASGINIDRLLANDNVLQVDNNGAVNIDYNNPAHRQVAKAWLRD